MSVPIGKQITGTLSGFLVILASSPFAGLAYAQVAGELKHWSDVIPGATHGVLWGLGMAGGWIWLKSPLSATLRGMVGSTTSMGPDGTKTETMFAKLPEPVPGTKVTTTIDQAAGTIQQTAVSDPKPKSDV